MRVDASELAAAAADFRLDASAVLDAAAPVFSKAGLEIKKRMAADFAQSQHFHQLAPTVTYDTKRTRNSLEVEVGVDPAKGVAGGRPGPLENIAYFGGANGGGGTIPDPIVHLEAEMGPLEKFTGDVIEKLLS